MKIKSKELHKIWAFFGFFCFGLIVLIVDSIVGMRFQSQPWSTRFHIFANFTMLVGFITYAVFTVWALRKHERSETARSLSDERFRLLFDHSPHGIYIIETREDDLPWRIIDCNPVTNLMNGYSRKELIGENAEKLLAELSLLENRRLFITALRKEKMIVNEALRRRKDGTEALVEDRVCLMELNGKEVLLGFVTDITERKRIEIALRESEAKYKALYDYSVDGIFLYDLGENFDWTITDCNEAACRMNGYSRQELIGMKIHELLDDECGVEHRKEVLENIRKGIRVVYEGNHRRKDGTVFPIESTSSLITIGGKEYLLGLDRDISARMQAENERRASEEKYRTVVENVEEAIFILDKTGKTLFINRYGQKLLGVSDAGFLLQEYLDAKMARGGMSIIQQVLRRNREFKSEMFSTIRGVPHWFRISIQPIGSESEASRVALCLAVDISEHKRQEQEIHAEKERLDVILRSIGEGVIATDLEGRVMFLNAAAERMTGWEREEAVGRMLSEVYRTSIDIKNKGKGCIDDLSNEAVLLDRQDNKRLISENGAVIRDAGARIIGMVVAFRDVTEKKRMEEDILKTQKLESLGYLAGGIAHDFNNILAALLTKIQLAEALYERGRDVTRHFKDMEKAVSRAGGLTQQLLTFSKGGKPIKKSLRLDGFLQETVGFALNGSRVMGEYALDPDLWLAEVDEGQISQAINNLVINAAQAMPEGGIVRISAENVLVRTEDTLPLSPGKYVKISVEDHGVGISEENLKMIYDPYFTTKQRGSGLGLTTTFSIIKRHGGYIDVESTLGKGSTFYIYLPAIESATEETENPNGMIAGKGRIALLDDDVDFLFTLKEALTLGGYSVEAFRDGRDLLERYGENFRNGNPFDLAILDLTIPAGMGGKETMTELRKITPEVKAIVMSGYSNDPVLAEHRFYGFSGMVVKPFSIEKLYGLITDTLFDSEKNHTA